MTAFHLHVSPRCCLQNAIQPRSPGFLSRWKTRCWTTAQSPLRRQLIEFVWAPWGLPASSRSCSTCCAGGNIWRCTQCCELNSRLCSQLSLLSEGCMALPELLNCTALCCGPKCCVLWSGMHFYWMLFLKETVVWNESIIFKKNYNSISFISVTCEKSSWPRNLLLSIYLWISYQVHLCIKHNNLHAQRPSACRAQAVREVITLWTLLMWMHTHTCILVSSH